MKNWIVTILALLSLGDGSACSRRDPGPLAGTWRISGVLPLIVRFRTGEIETMGFIEKVSYEIKGNQVIVSYESGPMRDSTIRYTLTGPNSARSEFGILQRLN
jgi:hypothetical protein